MSLYNELKRRNVFRVSIAYVAVAWLIAQVLQLVFESFATPDWVMKTILVLLATGLPFAVFFAWAFELTPEGLKREHEVDRTQTITHKTGRKLDFLIIGVLVVALGYFAYDKLVLSRARDAALVEATTQAVSEQSNAADSDKSIAVLPFVNMSDDAGNEYFSDGLSEELLNLLVKIPKLRVAARTSSFSYKGTGTKIAQIGEELNVTHVLEGSVRKSGDQLRITAQLIQADDGFHLWSQTYDRRLDNIFQIQDEIAAAVVDGLKITLLDAIAEPRKTDPEVYSLYLQGKYFINLRGVENLEKAVSALKQALAIDPEYAPAWARISWAYDLQVRARVLTRAQGFPLALEAVERALAIDDSMAGAWSSLAYLKKSYEWDWRVAKAASDKALQLEPNNTDVVGGAASLASSLGQLDKSIKLFERAVALDPLELGGLIALGNRYSVAGHFEKAFEMYDQVLLLNPEFPGVHGSIALTYARQGNHERALAEIDKTPEDGPFYRSLKATVLFTLGEEMEAQALTNEFLETSAREAPLLMAIIYAWRGENDAAFEWLEAAFAQRSRQLANILFNDAIVLLEGDPRYPVFLEKLGLLEYWEAMPP